MITAMYHNGVNTVVFSLPSGMNFWNARCEYCMDCVSSPFRSWRHA